MNLSGYSALWMAMLVAAAGPSATAPAPVSAAKTVGPPWVVHAATASVPEIVWPTPNPAFVRGGNISTWVQDTGAGDPHSGLFGCVRDNGTRFHEGIDLKAFARDRTGNPTDPIYAVMNGVVKYIDTAPSDGDYGRYIVLEHPQADVTMYTLYAHLAAIEPGLAVGQTVRAGQTIARMGHSGTEDIPLARAHMHFEIGLRLTDNFQAWFDSKKFGSLNAHGLYNGLNLWGMDEKAFFDTALAGKLVSFQDYLRHLPTAFTLRVTTARVPDFVKRYPGLLTRPAPAAALAGWEVDFTWDGLPKQWTPLTAGTPGLGASGAIALVAVSRAAFDGCGCRHTVVFSTTKPTAPPTIGAELTDELKLLFGFK